MGAIIERSSQHSVTATDDQRAIRISSPGAARLTLSTMNVDGAGTMYRPASDLLPGFLDGPPVLQTTNGIRGRDLRR